MGIIDGYDLVFPVWGGELDKNGLFDPKNIYGTAFYINDNKFVTCGHTIANAGQHAITALSFTDSQTNHVNFKRVLDSETFDDNDSGIVVTDIERAKPLQWQKQNLEMLKDVFSCGYPYGYDSIHDQVMIRSFKGHIVRTGTYLKFKSKPLHYELSYMCPRGLSGAPLLLSVGQQTRIIGMTIGNDMTDMIVSSFKETEADGTKVITYEKTETMHLGIAMQVGTFLDIKSRILNGTVGDYLSKAGLLV